MALVGPFLVNLTDSFRKGIEDKRAQQAKEVSKLRKKLVGDEAAPTRSKARRGSATSMVPVTALPGMIAEGEQDADSNRVRCELGLWHTTTRGEYSGIFCSL